jgi:hypothetical protein
MASGGRQRWSGGIQNQLLARELTGRPGPIRPLTFSPSLAAFGRTWQVSVFSPCTPGQPLCHAVCVCACSHRAPLPGRLQLQHAAGRQRGLQPWRHDEPALHRALQQGAPASAQRSSLQACCAAACARHPACLLVERPLCHPHNTCMQSAACLRGCRSRCL